MPVTDVGPETMATPENNFFKKLVKMEGPKQLEKVGSEVNVHFIYALVLRFSH